MLSYTCTVWYVKDFLERDSIMKNEKKPDRIGFTLSNGITFWFSNDSNGIKAMIDLLNHYDEMQGGRVFNGDKASYQ